MHLPVGTNVDDRFSITAVVGSGGLGTVYRARQNELDREIALKFLQVRSSSVADYERLKREALALSKLQHGNIVSFYGYGVWQQHPYLIMEYVSGHSLQEVLEQSEKLDLNTTLSIARQVCQALAHAHKSGIVHRDLKPLNIMLADQADGLLVKLIDFGMVKLLPEFGVDVQRLTQTSSAVGTLVYMAPEQCCGMPVDQRADTYSLGVVLHYCLSGEPPFNRTNEYSVMMAHAAHEPPRLASVHESVEPKKSELQKLLFKAMAKDPDERYQTAEEMLRDLQLVESGEKLNLPDAIGISCFIEKPDAATVDFSRAALRACSDTPDTLYERNDCWLRLSMVFVGLNRPKDCVQCLESSYALLPRVEALPHCNKIELSETYRRVSCLAALRQYPEISKPAYDTALRLFNQTLPRPSFAWLGMAECASMNSDMRTSWCIYRDHLADQVVSPRMNGLLGDYVVHTDFSCPDGSKTKVELLTYLKRAGKNGLAELLQKRQ